MSNKGPIRVFTGNGKGKTTAALGVALRAVAAGRKVFMVQFLKSPDSTGEHMSAKSLAPMLVIEPMGRKGFIRQGKGQPGDRDMALAALHEAKQAMLSGLYQVIILDEVNVAVHMKLLETEELLKFIEKKPEEVELVLTGRYAHPNITERADTVLEMKKMRHHFDEGIAATPGIEY
jgi:cob(I)alamin adenosyltransferase